MVGKVKEKKHCGIPRVEDADRFADVGANSGVDVVGLVFAAVALGPDIVFVRMIPVSDVEIAADPAAASLNVLPVRHCTPVPVLPVVLALSSVRRFELFPSFRVVALVSAAAKDLVPVVRLVVFFGPLLAAVAFVAAVGVAAVVAVAVVVAAAAVIFVAKAFAVEVVVAGVGVAGIADVGFAVVDIDAVEFAEIEAAAAAVGAEAVAVAVGYLAFAVLW